MEQRSISPWKLRLGALCLGALALVIVYGITLFYSNDVRLMYWTGSAVLFLAAVWLGRSKTEWLAATILVLPSLIAFSCLVLVDVSFLWPHLLLWLAVVGLGLMFPKLLRERRGTGIALFVVLIISSVAYCESYIPPRLAHKFNRFGDSSAPAFTLQPVSDGAVPITHTPGKVLVIDFFSTSCAPCIAELPAFAQVYSDLNRNPEIQFVLVASDKGRDTPERFRTFVQKRHISLPLAFDVGGKAHDSLGLTGVPAIVVVDRTGKIRLRREGYNSAEASFRRDLVHLVRSL